MVTVANLAIYEGDDYGATVTVLNPDGTPADLTGYEAAAQIRLGSADLNPAVVVEIGVVVVAPNQITLAIPNSITSQLSGCYAWDLQVVGPDGTITTILAGAVSVTPQITVEAGDTANRSARGPVGLATGVRLFNPPNIGWARPARLLR